MTEYIKIKLIKDGFETGSDFSKFDYGTVLTATTIGSTGVDVLVCDLEAAGAVIEEGGYEVTGQDDKPLFYFSGGDVLSPFGKEYEVINES